ncbi:2-C-methyl-D-erythritol 4-phosphate cytidylyltransferase [Candidatus Cyrtobacter comes]|uniref:2-C-methyl-D-erythritol 4-phosphate cytidylyltransferase n=1 Tax=Candidatus Cyrtobacter comes TaxID=675776 RepID=A0ABU5L8T0_9RICK|nr:IspD/TarI family cytidylyltransferase [Candidatus Cyrtobacter comes]MDZ5762524.1 2-C-methyl-D-erythritol 4-phosphate cytidylyltransferase [Candidatus Cyrtobacter comes]
MSTLILLCAGSSLRYAYGIKQFEVLAGIRVLFWPLYSFIETGLFDTVCITLPSHIMHCANISFEEHDITFHLIRGGEKRADSVANAISFLNSTSSAKVLVHDSARPFISTKIIRAVNDLLNTYDVVDVVMPISDTIKRIEGGNIDLIDRNHMFSTQTPQGFLSTMLAKAYMRPGYDQFTDDISYFIKSGIEIGIIYGEALNFKITYESDLEMARAIAESKITEMKNSSTWYALQQIMNKVEKLINIMPAC